MNAGLIMCVRAFVCVHECTCAHEGLLVCERCLCVCVRTREHVHAEAEAADAARRRAGGGAAPLSSSCRSEGFLWWRLTELQSLAGDCGTLCCLLVSGICSACQSDAPGTGPSLHSHSSIDCDRGSPLHSLPA